jgi:hypothetical protein
MTDQPTTFDQRLAEARRLGHWPGGRPFDQCLNPLPGLRVGWTGAHSQDCARCRYRLRYVGPDVHHMRWEHTDETWREAREDER